MFNTVGINMMQFILVQGFTAKGAELLMISLLPTLQYLFTNQISRPKFNYEGGYAKKLMMLSVMLLCKRIFRQRLSSI